MKVCSTTKVPTVQFDGDGIAVSWPAPRRRQSASAPHIRWVDVQKVCAYKKDCYSVDQIRLEFMTNGNDLLVATEDMTGWHELVRDLPHWLADFPEFKNWFLKTALQPFESNLVVLYDRRKA